MSIPLRKETDLLVVNPVFKLMKESIKVGKSPVDWKKEEKKYHERIASSYDDLCMQSKTLNTLINNQRLRLLLELCWQNPTNLVLDAGCGTGTLMKPLCQKGISTIGLDVSVEMTKITKKKCNPCEVVVGDIENLPFRPNLFTLSYCIASLHHLPRPRKAIGELIQTTKEDKHLYIEEPLNNIVFDFLRKITKMKTVQLSPCEASFYEDSLRRDFEENEVIVEKSGYRMFFVLLLMDKVKDKTIGRAIVSIDELISRIPLLNKYMFFVFFLMRKKSARCSHSS